MFGAYVPNNEQKRSRKQEAGHLQVPASLFSGILSMFVNYNANLALDFLELGMHLEVVSLKLILCSENFPAILASVTGMDFAIMLLPFYLAFKVAPHSSHLYSLS